LKIKKILNKWHLLAVAMILLIAALGTSVLPALASSEPNPVLNDPLVVGYQYGPSNTGAYIDIALDGGSAKAGWCVDHINTINVGQTYLANVYDYFGQYYPDYVDTLPASVQAVDWSAVAYVINHKVGSWNDIQNAIWYFTNGLDYAPGSNTDTMVTNTENYLSTHGGVYVPETGGVAPMVCYVSGSQLIFFEYPFTKPGEPLPEQPTALLFGLGLLGLVGFITIKRRARVAVTK
jgi:hypothetical protein